MSRERIASILTLAWCALQAWFLTIYVGIVGGRHLLGWGLVGVFLVIAIGLWVSKSWARLSLLVFGGALVIFYAVSYFLYGSGCGRFLHWWRCYSQLGAQPLLMVVALATVLISLVSNNRLERSRPWLRRAREGVDD
jgi:hypothetical protein